jgi:uncharacterized protein (UPF0333 family)
MKKILLLIFAIIIIAAGGVYYYVFVYSKNHHRDVQSEVAIVVSAEDLTKAYDTNEKDANAKYLDKAVQVSGPIIEIEGDTIITIGKTDAFTNVEIYLKSNTPVVNKIGDIITVKGKLIGKLANIKINEAVIK